MKLSDLNLILDIPFDKCGDPPPFSMEVYEVFQISLSASFVRSLEVERRKKKISNAL